MRIAAIDFGELYAGSNTFSVSVDNPERTALRLEVTLPNRQACSRTLARIIGNKN